MSFEKNSYTFDQFPDAEREAKRLSYRANKGLETVIPTLKEFGLRDDMTVVDVGAGTGVRAAHIAQFVTRGSVVGLDASTKLLEEARKNAAEKKLHNITFIECDVNKPSIDIPKFDFVHIRLVVQHLRNPIRVLKNCLHLLKPGGKIFVEDTDRDWMMLYPELPAWEKYYEKAKAIQKRKGGDPRSGRKLGYYLSKAGFRDIETRMVPICGSKDFIADWLENYAPTYFCNFGEKERKQYSLVLKQMAKRNEKGGLFFYQTWFQAGGTKN